MSTTTAEPTMVIDPRPLHVRLKEKITSDQFKTNTAAVVAGTAGGTAYAGAAYLSTVVGIAFLDTLALPAWIMSLALWSGALSITLAAVSGFWLGYKWVKKNDLA